MNQTPESTAWNFADVWETIAQAVPDRLEQVHGSSRITWAALDAIANGFAASRSAVLELLADGLDSKDINIERHAVVRFDRHDLAKRREQDVVRRISEAQKIQVTRRAVRFVEPGHKQHRALQHEAVAVS